MSGIKQIEENLADIISFVWGETDDDESFQCFQCMTIFLHVATYTQKVSMKSFFFESNVQEN